MSDPTFHTVSWAPSAIKDAVEHASEAFKAADGPFARVSTFELSALIDATRALIERNDWLESMPKVVCLSGSMRFEREMRAAAVDLSLEGHIVTGPFVNMKQPDLRWATDELADPIKVALDSLHFRKIDLADEVVVVSDETGYVGESTRNEIAYAEAHGKPVRHLRIALSPESPQVSVEELREKVASAVDDYTAGEDYGSGPTRYYLTVNTPDELTEHITAMLFPGLDWLFKAVADWQSLWDEKEEWEQAAKDAWKRETALAWLHAEAMWHAEHHRAQVEQQGLSHALLLRGFRGYADQVDAMARTIREQDAELAALRAEAGRG